MKVKFEEKEKKNRIPEVGEVWKHEDDDYIYMRINDEHGRSALGRENDYDSSFYSLGFHNLTVYSTPKNAKYIIILTPDRVENGMVIFVEKE